MKIDNEAGRLVLLLGNDKTIKQATRYYDDKFIIKATSHGKPDGRDRGRTIVVTFGKPNYAERKFIKKLKASHELFPVRKVQLKHYGR